MTRVFVFTPTWETRGGVAMREETRAALEAQALPAGVSMTWEIGLHNPYPGQNHRNVLAQFVRGRELFLESGADYLLLYEHDMVMPEGAIGMMLETMAGGYDGAEVGVVYAPYMLRHGSWALSTWMYLNDHNLGEPLSRFPEALAAARRAGVVRVCGCGFGCTMIRRSVVEAIPFHGGSGQQWAPDIPFAYDCIFGDVMCVADMRVGCDHLEGELRYRAYGGRMGMGGMMRVMALQDVTVTGDGLGTRRLEAGRTYEVGMRLAVDLMRAGYVKEVGAEAAHSDERRVTSGEGENSAVAGRNGDETVVDKGAAELAAFGPNEAAVTGRGKRKRRVAGG